MSSLTIVMPVYNERETLRTALDRLLAVTMPIPTEVLVVDDGSTDRCTETIADLVEAGQVRLITQDPNQGKGKALRRGIEEATGELLTVLDADLEYDPADFPALLQPILDGDANVVYGARSYGGHAAYSFWFVLGNKMLALWASFLFDAWLTDIETCLKVAPTTTWRRVDLQSNGFGIEAELTGKLLAMSERIFEVPISYRARGREEGKKIQWTDGVAALWILARIRLRGK
ncbi:glycosyltransferase family 2 protein [Aquihabitans sp. G128]|uniref:glycosyltransferase family 2 protein n=1 Tax=Aquihabitans sp. G128 TaxID=2849779 RepID=UPI001C21BD05|nr:glycosyltransferase family 2 protein [Aquihabitans sp. G128]QXC62108.1 glycosyltransferase family 2 protein [Aquihabitans sp. G128]